MNVTTTRFQRRERAYSRGYNSIQTGRSTCPYEDKEEQDAWHLGRREHIAGRRIQVMKQSIAAIVIIGFCVVMILGALSP